MVTTASHRIGPFFSGTFAVFPIVVGTFVVILHLHAGGQAAAAALAHTQPPLIGLFLGFLGVHYLAEVIGVWWAYAAGLAITVRMERRSAADASCLAEIGVTATPCRSPVRGRE